MTFATCSSFSVQLVALGRGTTFPPQHLPRLSEDCCSSLSPGPWPHHPPQVGRALCLHLLPEMRLTMSLPAPVLAVRLPLVPCLSWAFGEGQVSLMTHEWCSLCSPWHQRSLPRGCAPGESATPVECEVAQETPVPSRGRSSEQRPVSSSWWRAHCQPGLASRASGACAWNQSPLVPSWQGPLGAGGPGTLSPSLMSKARAFLSLALSLHLKNQDREPVVSPDKHRYLECCRDRGGRHQVGAGSGCT